MALFADRPKTHARAQKSFSEKVVQLALSVPEGRVTTYGALARAGGGGGMAAQSITTILSKATKSGVKNIPYHRIVYADGRVWINEEYRKQRLSLYKKEGIKLDARDRIQSFREILFEFT